MHQNVVNSCPDVLRGCWEVGIGAFLNGGMKGKGRPVNGLGLGGSAV